MLRSGKKFRMSLINQNKEVKVVPKYNDKSQFLRYTSDSLSFEDWKKSVDDLVFKQIYQHCDDLPDEDYWMEWYEKKTFQEMADGIVNDYQRMLAHYESLCFDSKFHRKKMKV